jgi:hypothetical protein
MPRPRPPARRGRTRRALQITAIAIGVTVVGSLIAAEVIGSATGCGSVDPTDPSNYSTAEVVNDTANSVIIGDCRGTYCGPQPSATLAPNEHAEVNGACGASGKHMTTWKITHPDGRPAGYIAIDTPRSTHDLTFDVTKASQDRLTPTQPN